MAHTQTHPQHRIPGFGLIVFIGASIFSALVKMAEAHSSVRKVEYLQSLSDEELARRGLKRDQIVHHVFAHYI